MIKRNFLSLDICCDELVAVALRRQGNKTVRLTGVRTVPLAADVWSLSVKGTNISDRLRFVEAVKEVLDPLAGGEDRIVLSLPDPVGRLFFTETDAAFKSRREGLEVVKWQLKKSLPADARDVQLDYQVLGKTEAGGWRLLVSAMVRSVLQQYEELLDQAGYHAVIVDFHSLNLYNYYRARLNLGEDFILVGLDGGGLLGLYFFQGKVPYFHRHKRIDADPQALFNEVNLSFAAIRESLPGFARAGVFLHTDWPDPSALLAALEGAFERDVVLLDPKIERVAAGTLPVGVVGNRRLVAAIGAAERLL